jgi:hypothetical protein
VGVAPPPPRGPATGPRRAAMSPPAAAAPAAPTVAAGALPALTPAPPAKTAATPPVPPAASTPPARRPGLSGAVVPVEELCYRGDAALRRALELQPLLAEALARDEEALEALAEVFDLIRLGLE